MPAQIPECLASRKQLAPHMVLCLAAGNKPNLRYDDAASSGSAARSRYTMTQARDVTAATDHLKLAQHSACIERNSVCAACVLYEQKIAIA